jgi:chromosome segregation ATPase
MDLKDINQNVENELRDSAIKYESFKIINESKITALEKEILSSKENCQKTLEKTENEKKLFEEMLEKLKVEIKDLKEKQKDSEGMIQESKALISKYENTNENLKKEIAEKYGKIKSLEDACLAAKDLLKAKLEQQRMTLQALKDKNAKKVSKKILFLFFLNSILQAN